MSKYFEVLFKIKIDGNKEKPVKRVITAFDKEEAIEVVKKNPNFSKIIYCNEKQDTYLGQVFPQLNDLKKELQKKHNYYKPAPKKQEKKK